jgi:hypothetical protein
MGRMMSRSGEQLEKKMSTAFLSMEIRGQQPGSTIKRG